jgi:hypothetical protein
MKLLGFKLEFGPTLDTKILYYKWLKKLGHWRCRFLHHTTWVLDPRLQGYRWYCCKDCSDTWVEPQRGTGVVD